jgi:hypothetical protein
VRLLGAAVAILAFVIIAMAQLGQFGPSQPTPARASPILGTPTPLPSPSPTGPRPITVTLTEQELTQAAQDYTPLTVSGITVTDPVITLATGRLTLRATGRAFFLSGPVVVVASPLVSDGKAAAQIESATFAGLALPESTKADIAETFSRTLAANIPAGVRVTSVTVGAGTLVIEAMPS